MVDVPVETYDERFTTALAGGGGRASEDARAAAHLLTSYLGASRGPASSSRAAIAAALVVLASAGAVAGCAPGGGSADTQTVVVTEAAPPPKPLHIVFPEGFTRKQMAARITAVDEIARKKRHVNPSSARAYLALTRRSKLPGRFAGDGRRRQLEGFLFPATYDFLGDTTTKQLVNEQLEAFDRAGPAST